MSPIAFNISETVLEYEWRSVYMETAVYPMGQTEYAVAAGEKRHRVERTHYIIIWRSKRSIMQLSFNFQMFSTKIQRTSGFGKAAVPQV